MPVDSGLQLSIPQGPIQSNRGGIIGDSALIFQFHKDQFKGGVVSSSSLPVTAFNSTRTNSKCSAALECAINGVFHFHKDQFKVVFTHIIGRIFITFNSTRTNSKKATIAATETRRTLSIPQGPIQSYFGSGAANSPVPFQFHKDQFKAEATDVARLVMVTFQLHKDQFKGRRTKLRDIFSLPFNSTSTNSKLPYELWKR